MGIRILNPYNVYRRCLNITGINDDNGIVLWDEISWYGYGLHRTKSLLLVLVREHELDFCMGLVEA